MSVNGIAVITGGNRGLGRATALALGAAGTDVVDEGLRTAMAERAALGRVGEPEDIGPVVAALDHRAGSPRWGRPCCRRACRARCSGTRRASPDRPAASSTAGSPTPPPGMPTTRTTGPG